MISRISLIFEPPFPIRDPHWNRITTWNQIHHQLTCDAGTTRRKVMGGRGTVPGDIKLLKSWVICWLWWFWWIWWWSSWIYKEFFFSSVSFFPWFAFPPRSFKDFEFVKLKHLRIIFLRRGKGHKCRDFNNPIYRGQCFHLINVDLPSYFNREKGARGCFHLISLDLPTTSGIN